MRSYTPKVNSLNGSSILTETYKMRVNKAGSWAKLGHRELRPVSAAVAHVFYSTEQSAARIFYSPGTKVFSRKSFYTYHNYLLLLSAKVVNTATLFKQQQHHGETKQESDTCQVPLS